MAKKRIPIVDGKTRCMSCREVKALGEFGVDASRWCGIQLRCKECCKRLHKEARGKHLRRLRPRPPVMQPYDPAIRLLSLTKGQVAIIGADRYDWAMQWNWCAFFNGYAYYAARNGRSGEPQTVFLHRQLMNEPAGEVDHINGDSLDNRVRNLRCCTRQQNGVNRGLQSNNTSGHIGVYQSGNKWHAQITAGRKKIYLGGFDNKEDAIAARMAAELKYFGEFAHFARALIVLPPYLQAAGTGGSEVGGVNQTS
jgi:hypothetical protein